MEKQARRVLIALTILTALTGVSHLAVVFWARHEITQCETLVALHSLMFSRTGHLYYDLNHYPFITTTYMPLFYVLSAALDLSGIPPLASGRLLSGAAAIGIIALAWRLLGLRTSSRYAQWTGTLLVAITANLWVWGTVGQVDVTGVLFSLAALYQYARYCRDSRPASLIWAGIWALTALYFKQTMIVSTGAIVLALARTNLRRAFWFAAAVGGASLCGVMALNSITSGRFLDNTVRANINPVNASKIRVQLEYLALAGGSLIAIVAAGASKAYRDRELLYIYLGIAAGVCALTAGKLGADLNYQVELLLALALCAGWTLDRVDFFPGLFRRNGATVTLLQMPLLLYAVVNLGISAKTIASRVALEPLRRQEFAELRPVLENARGPVISIEVDPLLHARGRIDIDCELYAAPRYAFNRADTRLVSGAKSFGKEGFSDGEPVRRDLADGKIPAVILLEDIFGPQRLAAAADDFPTLPKQHLDAMRKRYRLTRRIPGPLLDGAFLYEPIESPSPSAKTN